MSVDQSAMLGDVVDGRVLAVAERVEAIADMGRHQLDRVLAGRLRGRSALPAGDVAVERRPFWVLKRLQAFGDELDLAALRLHSLEPLSRIVAGQRERLGNVLLAALIVPAVRRGRAQRLLLGRHDVVAFPQELLPPDVFRDVRALEDALAPVELARSL